jgi:hypothetical protein
LGNLEKPTRDMQLPNYQISRLPNSLNARLVLCLHIAGFAAG